VNFLFTGSANTSFASAAATALAAWALAETMAALFVVFEIVDINNRQCMQQKSAETRWGFFVSNESHKKCIVFG
jgi:flavin-binding protein dodecin